MTGANASMFWLDECTNTRMHNKAQIGKNVSDQITDSDSATCSKNKLSGHFKLTFHVKNNQFCMFIYRSSISLSKHEIGPKCISILERFVCFWDDNCVVRNHQLQMIHTSISIKSGQKPEFFCRCQIPDSQTNQPVFELPASQSRSPPERFDHGTKLYLS